MPKYSVVVPVYNVESYLEECVNSVLNQKVTDFEIILVDDGSTDQSGTMCDRFALRDDRVKAIHQQNSGQSIARLNGVKHSTGDYIIFLDSDDYWLDCLLETVDNAIERFGCDMLVFRLQRGDEICHDFFCGNKPLVTLDDYFSVSLAESGMNPLTLKVFAAKLFENVDMSRFLHLRNSEDLVLSTMLAKQAKHISYITDVLYYYRPNDNSITHNLNVNAMDEFIVSRDVLWSELACLGLDTPKNKKVLYSAFLRRAADYVFQVSNSALPKKEKIILFDKVCHTNIFSQSMSSVDLSQLGKAKQLRLKLLSLRRYTILILLDKIKSRVI